MVTIVSCIEGLVRERAAEGEARLKQALGGLLIGMFSQFSDAYVDTAWTQVLIFALLILVLVFRPSGLLGMRVPEK